MDREAVDEIKRHFGIVAEDLRSEVRAVAEAQSLTNERLDRLEQRVERGFSEVQSMIRLSYAEIDRRFGELEIQVSDLRSRVERLEARET